MRLVIGNLTLADNSVVCNCETDLVIDTPGMPPRARTDILTVDGWLADSTQAGITAQVLALNAALSGMAYDVTLYHDDNVTPSAHRLWNAGSTSGTKCTKLVYPQTPPASLASTKQSNYVTQKAFTAVITATYPLQAAGTLLAGGVPFGGPGPIGSVPALQGQGAGWVQAPVPPFPYGGGGGGSSSNLPSSSSPGKLGAGGTLGQNTGAGAASGALFAGIAPVSGGALAPGIPGAAAAVVTKFQETISLAGGGPKIVWLPSINGPFQPQITYPQLPYTATQSGTATGWLTYPNPPPPLWPASLIETPRVTRISPQRNGQDYEMYEVRWTYSYESLTPLAGAVPNVYRI